jgi:hypothetical protein
MKLIEDKITSVSAKEQKHHEKEKALTYDSLCWIEEDISEELYNIYMTTFLKNALAGSRKDRKPLLVYAGLEQASIEKTKDDEVYKKVKNESANLLKQIF